MPLRILTNGSTQSIDDTQTGAPAVELAGNGIRLINTELGRILGSDATVPALLVSGTGSTIENAAGAIIQPFGGRFASTEVSIRGGAGNDILRNDGAIFGTVDLGGGDDQVVQGATAASGARFVLGIGQDSLSITASPGLPSSGVVADGGEGTDTITLNGLFGSFEATGVVNFEKLVISAQVGNANPFGNNLSGLTGFSQVVITDGSYSNFVNSANPLADLTVSGGSTNISNGSVFKSLTGSNANEFVSINGGPSASGRVLGAIALGGGDDNLFLSVDAATFVAPVSADGGAGDDRVTLVTSGVLDIDFATFSGFETITDGGNPRTDAITLRNADRVTSINLSQRSAINLIDSQSPDGRLQGIGSRISISANSVVGQFGFVGLPFFLTRAELLLEPNADLRSSTTIINQGSILGGVDLYYGDDVYDGTTGITGGPVYGYAGNDVLRGGSAGDEIHGGFGADQLFGNAGRDRLFGDQGGDRLDGGAGLDTAVFAIARSAATISRDATLQALTVTSASEGTDRLQRVEQLQFTDGLFSFAFAQTGALLVSNFAVGAGGWTSQTLYPRQVADVNGDGYGDIVGFGAAGTLVSFGSAAGTFSSAGLRIADFGQASGWADNNRFHRELADVNGDGRADIVGFGSVGTLVALARADGSFAAPTLGLADFGVNQGWTSQDGFARVTGDVNGDGKADIVGFGSAGTLVSLGNGDGTFKAPVLGTANFGVNQGWLSDDRMHRALGDVNGDGKADLIGFNGTGTLVAISRGNGTFADPVAALNDFGTAQGWGSNDATPRTLADINADGFADIVGFGFASTLVAFGKGDGTFSQAGADLANFAQVQGWTSDARFHRTVADLNNDGRPDIVGFGQAGVLAGMNQGDFLI